MNLIDALDRTIVEHLEFDGRCSMQDLSDLTGLSRSAVFARVKRLENDGAILEEQGAAAAVALYNSTYTYFIS